MNGADLIAHILKREGVEILPGFPHSDLIEAAAKVGIRPLIVRQERHALHMADGYTRATGGNKLCCTTVQYGPGSENAMGGIAQCFADNVPILHIPGGYSRDAQGVSPNFSAAKNMQGITKWCEMVQQAGRIPQMMQNAFTLLRNGCPGPVVLEVPHDIFTEEINSDLVEQYKPQRHSAPTADPKEISEIVNILLESNAPVIIAGQGILYAGATEELVTLAERTQTPVISTLNGKSAFPENHPLALGCAGLSQPDGVIHFLDKADLILGLGTSFTRSEYITPFPTQGRVYAQVTNWEGDLSKDYPIDLGVIGDAKSTIAAINHEIQFRLGTKTLWDDGVIAKEILSVKQAFLKQWRPLLESNKRPINPYRVIWDLMHVVDRKKTIITHEAGSPRDQTVPFYEAIVPHGYIGWGKTTQLGTSLGLIQGAKLSKPDYTCVNIMGDAAIGMVGMDFETAARNQIGTTTIVLKNSIMGDYTSYHPVAAEKFGIHKLGGDYADIALALGGYGERVTEPETLKSALKRAFAENSEGIPALIEVITSEESQKSIPSQSKN
jgi:acetolactate synthase-1/2/3 large subunit